MTTRNWSWRRKKQEMDTASLEKAAEEAPIIKLVNLILTDSVKRGASDIHVEPYETEMRVQVPRGRRAADGDESAAEAAATRLPAA